MSCDNPLQST